MPEDAVEGAAGDAAAVVAPGPTVRLPVAVLVVVATVVVALLAIWGATVLDVRRLPTGPAQAPPTGPAAPTELTVDGRDASLQEFSMTLAGPPFVCEKADTPPASAFPSFASCYYPVHKDYDGSTNSWVATTGVALLDPSVVKPTLDDTAQAAFEALYAMSFTPADHPKVVGAASDAVQIALPRERYATYGARIEVSKKGLPTPYDRVVVIVLRLQSGAHVVVFSDFPHDGGQEALKAVATSIGTVSLG